MRAAANSKSTWNIDRLALLEDVVAEMGHRLAALEGRRRRTPDQESERLLGAIAGYVGSSVFASADLLAAHDAVLKAALDGMNGREIGSWLKRMRKRKAGLLYRVERVGRDEAGALWRLYQA